MNKKRGLPANILLPNKIRIGSEKVMRIFISGVGCVGKTTVGKKLAEELGYKFIDIDGEVEKYYGKAISYLQKESMGLEKFRQKVAAVLREIVNNNQDNYVVALQPSGFRQPCWKIIKSVNDPITERRFKLYGMSLL